MLHQEDLDYNIVPQNIHHLREVLERLSLGFDGHSYIRS